MEAEVTGTFINAKEGVNVSKIIHSMGHPQPSTPLLTKNLTAFGIVSGKIKQQRSKAIDVCFYWLKDREAQDQCIAFW
jgi:predicted transcriptional regulator